MSLVVFITVMVCQSVVAGIIQVPKDHITIQAGIDAAVDGDTVLVADGLYMGVGNVNLDFKGKSITVKSASGADKCMIDCQKVNQTRGFIFRHQETKDAIVSGFTIKNGNFKEGNGGGIHCSDASPTIISCILTENVAEAGGGIFCDNAFTIIIDCLITKNQAKGGGGIQFHRGSPTITGCRISENTAGTGGGVFLTKSSVVVTNALVYKNQADYGGGILCWSDSLLFLHSSTITDNIAMYGGGLFFSESDTMLVNSILHQNSESINNKPQQIYFGKSDQSTVADISYCLIQGGRTGVISDETVTLKWGSGNISDDPMFVNPTAGDYRLQDNSLGIASGIKDDSMPTVDIEGRDRPFPAESRPDLGAYEHDRGKRVSDPPDEPLTAINPGILITTNKGKIRLVVYPESAPITVKNFYRLIQEQFYDGLTFHRYVPKFVIQGGCPLGTGAGGPGWTIRGEFQDPSLRSKMPKHTRGVLAMARAQAPDSAGSQFYICLEDAPHLDGNYTAFGRVIEGMEVVDQLRQGDKMVSVQLISDTSVPRVPSTITIPDVNLRSALEKALGKKKGDAITKQDLAGLEELKIDTDGKPESEKISDLTGLGHCTNLTYLDLTHNQINNLSPLSNLTSLVMVELQQNQLTDLNGLADANLPSLELLSLQSNQISDLKGLANAKLPSLKALYLHNNQLKDLSTLANVSLPSLELLSLTSNQLSDLKGLVTANLPNLARLYLNNNQISDVSQLAVRSLSEINLKNNPLNSVALFTHIPALKARGIKVEYDMFDVVVVFNDPNLEKGIRDALGIPTGQLKKSDLAKLKKLYLSGYKLAENERIVDLAGIEYSINLAELQIVESQISDLSPLATLTNLILLSLGTNQIKDISPLANLNNLKTLYLAYNQIDDIGPLANLTNLTTLELQYNQISNVKPLANLTSLAWLKLNNNQINDLSGLANFNLPNLWYLRLHRNRLTSLTSLANANLPNLTYLNLASNGLTNLIGLANATLPNLTQLNLEHNQISDISSLANLDNLASLTYLYLNNNQIKDISPLANRTSLTYLYLEYNQISDISPLANLTKLEHLYLTQLRVRDHRIIISDISSLADLNNLKQLGLSRNQISNISPLANLTNLILLSLGTNQIRDISPLVNNGGIKGSIDLKDNPLSKTSVLTHISALKARGIKVEFNYPASWDDEQALVGDVNGDNQVDLFDLVEVASMFGKKGEGLAADISGDGQVDLFDLVQVAGNFGKSNVAAAPTVLANKRAFTTQQKRSIQSAIVELEGMLVRSEAEELVFNLLQAVLPERLPEQTQLLPNYPNPFNPETWIPFELSQDSEVSVTIYNVAGTPVRSISVGYLEAGRYVSQSSAIYWDGRTDTGERVASGIYLYQIQAGDYADTRKMVILK